ncbi:MAG: hypothetical protein ABFD60_07215 [Bryobacteraceae bacterium]
MAAFARQPAHAVFLLLPVVLLLVASPAYTQTHGYGFAGIGIGDDMPGNGALRYGLGGNWAVIPNLTLGGELGGYHKDSRGGIIASGNVGIHFRGTAPTGLDPFVTGGITGARIGDERSGRYANLGGGLNYWFRPRVGFRVEFRGYLAGSGVESFSEIRFGLAFH